MVLGADTLSFTEMEALLVAVSPVSRWFHSFHPFWVCIKSVCPKVADGHSTSMFHLIFLPLWTGIVSIEPVASCNIVAPTHSITLAIWSLLPEVGSISVLPFWSVKVKFLVKVKFIFTTIQSNHKIIVYHALI